MRWYPFIDVVTDVTSKFNKVQTSAYKAQGLYKIVDQGKEAVAGFTDDECLVNAELSPIIVFGDHTRVIKYVDSPIVLGADGAKALKVNSRLANTLYVYYYLRSVKLKEAGYSRHFKFLKEIQIPIPLKNGEPDLDNQKRIVHLLGKVEGLITQRKQHLQQLDDMLKSVFLEMFGDPVRNEKGWAKDRIGKSTKVQGGFAFKSKDLTSKGTVRLVKIANVNFEVLVWDDITYIPDHCYEDYKRFVLQEGDLLIALTRPVIKSLDVVKTATVRRCDLPSMLNQRVARFICNNNSINKRFLLQYCYTSFFKATVDNLCPPGLQPNISTGQIEDITIYYPPIELQNHFAAIAEKVAGIKSLYQKSVYDLENLYGALSQKAFKGELDLSRVPLEPLTIRDDNSPEIGSTTIETPIETSDKSTVSSPEGRIDFLKQCFTNLLAISSSGNLSFSDYLQEVQLDSIRLWGQDDFIAESTLSEYDLFKEWLFEAIDTGRVEQTRNTIEVDGKPDFGNQIVLKRRDCGN